MGNLQEEDICSGNQTQLITYSSFSAEEINGQISMRQTGVLEFPVLKETSKWIKKSGDCLVFFQ